MTFAGTVGQHGRMMRILAGVLVLGVLGGCLFKDSVTTKDLSDFKVYSFTHRPALGFCADPDGLFSARLSRGMTGGLTMDAEILALVGPDPADCEGGVASEQGCFRPVAVASRELKPAEIDDVAAVFTKVAYHRKPFSECRTIAFDPCVIQQHSWDEVTLSDYICGADRLTDDQSKALDGLLVRLRKGI